MLPFKVLELDLIDFVLQGFDLITLMTHNNNQGNQDNHDYDYGFTDLPVIKTDLVFAWVLIFHLNSLVRFISG